MTKNVKYTVFAIMVVLFVVYPKCGPVFTDNSCNSSIFYIANKAIMSGIGIVHEGGHGVCYILHCPQSITVANGTIFQHLFPILVSWYYRKRDKFASYVALFFLGPSLQYTSWYMKSATSDYYNPTGEGTFLGGPGYHDFGYLFTTYNILDYKDVFSMSFHILAMIVMVASVIGMLLNLFNENK